MKKIIIIAVALIISFSAKSQFVLRYNTVILPNSTVANKLNTTIIFNEDITTVDVYFTDNNMRGHYVIITSSEESYDGLVVHETINQETKQIVYILVDVKKDIIRVGDFVIFNQ